MYEKSSKLRSFYGAGFILIYSHFIRYENVFAHFKESVLQMKIQGFTRSDFIVKELILCKETFLSETVSDWKCGARFHKFNTYIKLFQCYINI